MRLYRFVLAGALLVGVLSGYVDGGTLANFTGGAVSTQNQFTAGTVDIAHSPATTLLSASGMLPGTKVTAPLTVTNQGSLDLRYALSSSVTNADGKGLGHQLLLTIKSGVSDCSTAGFGGSGSVVYGPDQPLGDLGSARNLIGDPSVSPNGGRTVTTATHSEVLCFQVTLPSGTPNSYENASTTASFNFSAEQL